MRYSPRSLLVAVRSSRSSRPFGVEVGEREFAFAVGSDGVGGDRPLALLPARVTAVLLDVHAQRELGLAERFVGDGVEDEAFETRLIGVLRDGLRGLRMEGERGG